MSEYHSEAFSSTGEYQLPLPDRPKTVGRLGAIARHAAEVVGGALAAISTGALLVYTGADTPEGHGGLNADVPDELPAAVSQQVENAVFLQSSFPQQVSTGPEGVTYSDWDTTALSGVSLGKGWVLSAGHGFRDELNQPRSPLPCANFDVYGLKPNGDWYSAQPTRETSNFTPDFSRDYAMLYVSGMPEDDTPIKIADTLPKRNSIVYFINWQPDPEGERRRPYSTDPLLASPAIYPGVVGEVNGQMAAVYTDITSYSKGKSDMSLEKGGSGGMVVNSQGELVGISNARVHVDSEIGPFGLPGDINVGKVTLVNDALIDKLEDQAAESDPCVRIPAPG